MPDIKSPETPELPPFSRPFDVETQKDYPAMVEISANEAERGAVAALLGIPAVASLTAKLKIASAPGWRFVVSGAVDARVTRICVVSLDPFEVAAHESVEGYFAAPPEKGRRPTSAPPREVIVEADDDAPDPLVDGCIDLGTLACEFLALGLDPHPRKPGIVFEPPKDATPPEASPFAVLERLKKPNPPE